MSFVVLIANVVRSRLIPTTLIPVLRMQSRVVYVGLAFLTSALTIPANAACPYDPDCLNNRYGAGNPYKPDGLMNPNSRYGSRYSNDSHTNPYATNAPKLYDQNGNYRGRLSNNPYDPESTSNPYGRYGSRHSPDSINNPYGAGNPYGNRKIYVVPQ